MDNSIWTQDPCIMFVDGDADTRDFVRTTLEREGFKVLIARNSVEALVLAADFPLTIDLLITESGNRVYQNGMQLVECFGVLRPETRVLLTGRKENDASGMRTDGIGAGPTITPRILELPLKASELTGAVMRALDYAPVIFP